MTTRVSPRTTRQARFESKVPLNTVSRTVKQPVKGFKRLTTDEISQKQQELDYINAVLRERNLTDDFSKYIHKGFDWILDKINPDNQSTDSALMKRRAFLQKQLRAAGYKA